MRLDWEFRGSGMCVFGNGQVGRCLDSDRPIWVVSYWMGCLFSGSTELFGFR